MSVRRIPGKLEAAWRLARIDILRQGKNLKSPSEHFRMKQRLERTLRLFISDDFRQRRDETSKKVMLIGEATHAQSIFFRSFRDVGPIDMGGDVGLTDLFERRIEMSMFRAHLESLVKIAPRKAIVDRENETALQFPRNVRNPIELRSVGYLTNRRIDEDELVAGKIDKLAAQIDRH